MADVPLSLAVISTITPVIAGIVPLAVGWLGKAGRDRPAVAERLRDVIEGAIDRHARAY